MLQCHLRAFLQHPGLSSQPLQLSQLSQLQLSQLLTAAANVAILKLKTCSANSIEVAGEGNEVAVREEMITKFHKHLPHKSKVFSFYLYKCHS